MVKSKGRSCFQIFTFASNKEEDSDDDDFESKRWNSGKCDSLVPTSIYCNTQYLPTPHELINMTQNRQYIATPDTIDVSHWGSALTSVGKEDVNNTSAKISSSHPSKNHFLTSQLSSTEAHVPSPRVTPPLVTASFRKLADFPNYADKQKPLEDLCNYFHVSGYINLSPEGVMATISGRRDFVEVVLDYIQMDGIQVDEQEAFNNELKISPPLGAVVRVEVMDKLPQQMSEILAEVSLRNVE